MTDCMNSDSQLDKLEADCLRAFTDLEALIKKTERLQGKKLDWYVGLSDDMPSDYLKAVAKDVHRKIINIGEPE